MNNNNNNKNKSQKGAQKAAAQIANLANEVKQLRAQAKKGGGNAKPSRVRQRRQKGGAGNFGRNGNDTGVNMQTKWSYIEKDELISAVNGSILLAATKYAINPGLPETFPVGAPEAKRWTEWKAEHCEFYFQRTVSEFATQGQVGRVVLAIDYSALNDAPDTLQAAELLHSAKGMPCTPRIGLRADTAILNKSDPKYIRTTSPPPGSDIRLFDGGNLWFVTSGCTNATEIGELRVKYKFAVRLPNLDDTPVKTSRVMSMFYRAITQTIATGVDTILVADTELVNPLGIDLGGTGTFTLPAGAYVVRIGAGFSDSASETFSSYVHLELTGVAEPVRSQVLGAAVATQNQRHYLEWYVESDGSDYLDIKATLSGAAGTLNLDANEFTVSFTAV